ncbi:hypothetical protein ISN44_As06g037020 [Arabidopsis suecica]|uniref:Uncharacterized protein n=1 Tax=Arabidopsis suecica TaxID=45249 RepID=A0A8T2CMY2_ARASU|nr:hypothetical protein ISN44_As06g037020 [Arabidopsis suecica]
MSNSPSEIRGCEVEDLKAFMGEETEPHTQTGDGFDLHPQSQSTVESLNDLRLLCHIPPEVEMVVPKPYESPESGREGYCCAYEIYFKGCGLFLPLPDILLTYLNHLGIAFSHMSSNMLLYLMCTFTVAAEAGYSLGLSELLELFQTRESRTSGYYALYPIADQNLVDDLPLKDNVWKKFWFFFRINSTQIRPVPSVDFLNFYKVVLERPVNWNSFTLERIHGAGHSVRMGLTLPVDPHPVEIDLSSLNARDRRRIKEADKKIKDQISLIGKNKKSATSSGDDKIYRKTLLVDDGSLEGSKSMAVVKNNAPLPTPAADNTIAATTEEESLIGDSSFMKKRKAEELEPPLQSRPKSTRKDITTPSNLSISESAEAQELDHLRAQDLLPGPHLNQATLDVNGIVNYYEEELTKVSKRADIAEGEIEKLQSSNQLVKETAGLDSARQREIEQLERSGEETRKNLADIEQKLKTALADHDFAKAWNKLSSERDEMKSNLDLIKEIEEGSINLAIEKETVGAELAETEAKLAIALQPYLDLQQFASEFADSPPLTEPNTGLSLDETMLTGSPSAHFNEFGTNVDKIYLERTQGFSGQNPAIFSIMEDDFGSRSETPQDATIGGAPMASPQDESSGPNPPRLPSSESLFPTGDGFTPQGVAIPCFLSSMSKEEKIECHEFMEQITERYVFLCSERQRLGRKRRDLEDRIARTERKIRRLESDVHNWERRGFDSIARIPSCLREHIRCSPLLDFINNNSIRFEEGNSSENPSDSFKMLGDDLPGTSDIELVKTEATGEPEESRRLGWGTNIQVPNVLVERLLAQDRIKAEEFINKLIARHNELEDEKIEIRKRRIELEKRRLDIAREIHRLEAHPSDWIEIGLQEYGTMPGCILSIVDLAGQGAELFRHPRPF